MFVRESWERGGGNRRSGSHLIAQVAGEDDEDPFRDVAEDVSLCMTDGRGAVVVQ